MSPNAKRVGVMMGGLSSERGISLKSGKSVFDNLKKSGWDAVALEVVHETEAEIRRLIAEYAVDVVFIAMHGGFGEGGRLQHILEKMHMPYTGSDEKSSRQAIDKIHSRRLFKKAKLCIPKYRCISRRSNSLCLSFLRYPLVVKPSTQGSSIGISFIDSPSRLRDALALAFKFDDNVLVEEFIRGREMTVSVFEGQPLPIVEIIPKGEFFDFQAKYENGLTEYIVPARLSSPATERVQRDAVSAYQVLGCRHLCRVDMIVTQDSTPYILEVNTIPGMTEVSLLPKAARAAGISFDSLCTKLVELALIGEPAVNEKK